MREAASFIASQTMSGRASSLDFVLHTLRGVAHALVNRRKLTTLGEFDDHMLADIGLTRDDVRSALDAPWSHDPSAELQLRALRNRRRGWRDGR